MKVIKIWLSGILVVCVFLMTVYFMHQSDKRNQLRLLQKTERFMEAARPSIEWLRACKSSGEEYPKSLLPNHHQRLENVQSDDWYRVNDKNSECYLGFGDYEKDGFTFYWWSLPDRWELDD